MEPREARRAHPASELGVGYGRHPVARGHIAAQLCRGWGARVWLGQSWSQPAPGKRRKPPGGQGAGGRAARPQFQPRRGLRSTSGEQGVFLGLRGTACLVPPRASHLMLPEVPPHLSALAHAGEQPPAQGLLLQAPDAPWFLRPDSSPRISWATRVKPGPDICWAGPGSSSVALALMLLPSCVSRSPTAASVGRSGSAVTLPLFTSLGTCSASLVLSTWLSAAPPRSSGPSTTLHTPPAGLRPQARAPAPPGKGAAAVFSCAEAPEVPPGLPSYSVSLLPPPPPEQP